MRAFASATKDIGLDVHATEVDPIAEAEVYIAYGREAQAEEILREALRKQPERQAIRAKLLEIYSGRKDIPAFGMLAREMYDATGGQNEEWPKVVTMGLALDPDNPLYTGAAVPAAPLADAAPEPASAASDLLADAPSEPALEDETALKVPELPAAGPSLAETMPLDPADLTAKPATEPDVPALDFDLELDTTIGKAGQMLSESRDPGAGGRSELARAVEGKFELPDLDLTTALGEKAEAPAAEKSRAEGTPGALEEFNIDLPALEGISKIVPPRSKTAVAEAAPELDLSAIGLDLEPSPVPAAAGATDGVRWQEMATKLDLASAYEEIGDKEGARELLDEVLKGGDADQQQKARAMLAKIA